MPRYGEFRLARTLRRFRSRFPFAETIRARPATMVERRIKKSHSLTTPRSFFEHRSRRAPGGSVEQGKSRSFRSRKWAGRRMRAHGLSGRESKGWLSLAMTAKIRRNAGIFRL